MKFLSLNTHYTFFALVALLFSVSVYASKTAENCAYAQKDDAEYSRCLDGIKESVDRELQTWVNNHLFTLEEMVLVTGRRSALDMFKRSQQNFITYRENNCRWQYLAISPGTGAAAAYKKCYLLLSNHKIDELSKIKF